MINNAKVVKADIKTSNGIIRHRYGFDPEAKKVAGNTNHIIKQAIHKGVPMFNSGHHAQTAALYMRQVRKFSDSAPPRPARFRQ